MTTRKIVLVTAILASVVSGAAFAAQIPYATFTGAGAVSNMTFITNEGSGCTANCEDFAPVYGGHGFALDGSNSVTYMRDGTLFTSSTDYISVRAAPAMQRFLRQRMLSWGSAG